MSNEMNTQEEKKVLTQKDLNKAMFRWYRELHFVEVFHIF